jgi:hypothetical protein
MSEISPSLDKTLRQSKSTIEHRESNPDIPADVMAPPEEEMAAGHAYRLHRTMTARTAPFLMVKPEYRAVGHVAIRPCPK